MDEENGDHLNERKIKKSTYNVLIITIIITTGIAAFFGGSYTSNLNSEQITQKELENALAKLELKILEKQLPTKQPNIPLKISIDNDPIIGSPNAPITIIEFSDFQCPFCARFHVETLPLIMNEYINQGQVKLVFRDFQFKVFIQMHYQHQLQQNVQMSRENLKKCMTHYLKIRMNGIIKA